MPDLKTHYQLKHGPALAAGWLAKDLMRGDPATHKAGYTIENAVLAAAEQFDILTSEVRDQLAIIDAEGH